MFQYLGLNQDTNTWTGVCRSATEIKDVSSETPEYNFSISRVTVTDISLSMRCKKVHKTGLFYGLSKIKIM